MVKLEVCVDSLDSALAAIEGGASRLELCSGLDLGGLTPGPGLLQAVLSQKKLPVHVLIRPRAGDFCYSADELAMMETDICQANNLGAAGVVFGALTHCGSVDEPAVSRLTQAAKGMQVTFHRAFDLASDPWSALETLLEMGIHYLLSSGQAPSAVEGKGLLRELVRRTKGKLAVMPGGGVNESNAGALARATGAEWLHASARSSYPGPMSFRREHLSMGLPGHDEYSRWRTDADKVRSIIRAAQSIDCAES